MADKLDSFESTERWLTEALLKHKRQRENKLEKRNKADREKRSLMHTDQRPKMEKYDFEKMTIETLKTILCQGLSEKFESVFWSMFYPDESTCQKQGDFEDLTIFRHKES